MVTHLPREWLCTLVFLPEQFHGWRTLTGYSPKGCKEWDTTEQLCAQVLLKVYNKGPSAYQSEKVSRAVVSLRPHGLFVNPWTVARQTPLSGILQARILECVVLSFSRDFFSPLKDDTGVSFIASRFFIIWTTREALTPSRHSINICCVKPFRKTY